MTPSTSALDRAFARFRETGDPAALGTVFDGTAPELLRIASHLISDLSLAEDLVQTTFLAAIQKCRDYDPTRPVLPWLVGILTNRAHLLRRARGKSPDPDRLEPAPVPIPDPEQAAEARELTKAVTDAIAGTPEPYRPVLMMHLRHGFSAQEIALTLGRAPGTVRKQLSRGLDMLRRALPAGFAATVSSTVLTTQGLSAMREAVLGAAKLVGPVSVTMAAAVAPVAIGGVVLMKKAVLMTTAIVSAACVGYLVWPDAADADVDVTSNARDTAVSSLAGEVNPASKGRAGVSNSQPDNRQPLAGPVAAATSKVTVFEGRCVSKKTGLPLAGCKVRLSGGARSSEAFEEYVLRHGDVQWEDMEPQVTGPDGRFRFRFVPPPPYHFVVWVTKEGLVPRVGSWEELHPGTTQDLGDVQLDEGALVSGRILDPEGRPLADKHIGFRLQDRRYPSGVLLASPSTDFRSDQDGVFVARMLSPSMMR